MALELCRELWPLCPDLQDAFKLKKHHGRVETFLITAYGHASLGDPHGRLRERDPLSATLSRLAARRKMGEESEPSESVVHCFEARKGLINFMESKPANRVFSRQDTRTTRYNIVRIKKSQHCDGILDTLHFIKKGKVFFLPDERMRGPYSVHSS